MGGTCVSCGKAIEPHVNYCDWQCHIDLAKHEGGRVICPNGLPITCIRYDSTMMEHEHADHPNYRFPVVVEFVGTRPELPDWDDSYTQETHALIYTDGSVALTMYECNYGLFSVHDGLSIAGPGWKRGEWKLSQESLTKVQWLLGVGPAPGESRQRTVV